MTERHFDEAVQDAKDSGKKTLRFRIAMKKKNFNSKTNLIHEQDLMTVNLDQVMKTDFEEDIG